jgi:hypothetical protein
MLQIQLYIEGKQVELYKDESVSLTQSIQDIKDISKIFTDFTRTFNVPASKNNNKIFKHFYNFNLRSYNYKTGEYENYDARKKKDAQLFLNYKPFKEGKIKFEGVSLKNNEPHSYKITFFGNILNLKDTLKEDKLSNLSRLSLFNFDYNDANVTTYMTNGLDVDIVSEIIDDAIIFPLITHSSRLIYDETLENDPANKIYNVNRSAGATNLFGVPISELKPAIRLYAIIKAIELEPSYNLKFSTDFFNKTNYDFYSLYLWLHNKEGGLFVDQEAQYQITGFNSVVGDVGQITGATNSTFVNTYDESNTERVLRVTVRPSGIAAYNLVVKKNGEEFQRFDNLTGNTTNGGGSNAAGEDILIPNGTYTFFIETAAASTYDVDIAIQIKKNGIFRRNFQITIKNASASFSVDQRVNISSIIPEMKVIDFLTGLFKMFNLTAYQDTNGIIVVKPLDSFFASSTKVWDITKHLDKTQTMVESVLPFKDINFKYKSTDSFLAKNHNQLSNKAWGELDYRSSDKFDGETYQVELPFEHFKYEHLYVTDNGVVQTTTTPTGDEQKTNSLVQYGYSVDKNRDPYLGLPLIFYKGQSLSEIGVLLTDLLTNQLVQAPYLPANISSTVDLFNIGDFQNLNFNAEYDEWNRTVNNKTLFKTFYESYVKDMFDVRKRLTTVKAYLPLEITLKLNLADKIIVFDNVYRINKITTNFETNLSTIELNNIFEEVTYKTLVTVAQSCLQVDTTNYRASNGSFRASGNCDTDFTIPDIQTVVPNTIPSNDPAPIYDNIPLIVLPPLIKEYTVTVPTSTSVFFDYEVFAKGSLGGTLQVDEYGFLYSTNQSSLTASNDVDVLKATGGVFEVPYIANQFFTTPKVVNYEKSGLTHPQTYYWRFYARTNTDPAYAFADAISDVKTASTVSAPINQYNNATGEFLSGFVGDDLTGTCNYCHGTMTFGYQTYSSKLYPADLDGVNDFIVFYNIMNKWSAEVYKEITKWFTSEPDPALGTWYPISHTWKYRNNQGNDGFFNMGIITNAYIKYDLTPRNTINIFIKGGVITGSSFGGGSGNILNDTGDLESTSG